MRLLGAAALACFFLALLSKENGVTFLAIIPIALACFTPLDAKRIARVMGPFLAVTAGYLLLRFSVIGPGLIEGSVDVLNHPYLKAGVAEKYATIVLTLGRYLLLMLFPHPLSWDYSYPAIPYVPPTDPRVWIAAAATVAPPVWAFLNLRRSRVLAFGILFYTVSILLVSNLVLNIGAALGERLAFQASLGFAIVAAVFLVWLHARLRTRAPWAVPVLVIFVTMLGAAKTVTRSSAWHDNETLFLTDVRSTPNSSKTNQGAGSVLMGRATRVAEPAERARLLDEAEPYLLRAVTLNPDYSGAYFDLCRLALLEGDAATAERYLEEARRIHPRHHLFATYDPVLAKHHRQEGLRALSEGRGEHALDAFTKAARYAPSDRQSWYDLAYAQQSRRLFAEAVESYRKAIALDPGNPESWNGLGTAYYQMTRYGEAEEAWERTLALDPDHASARGNLNALRAAAGRP